MCQTRYTLGIEVANIFMYCISKIDDWVLAGNPCNIIPPVTLTALDPKLKQHNKILQDMASMRWNKRQTTKTTIRAKIQV
jgi:hypothetical protein